MLARTIKRVLPHHERSRTGADFRGRALGGAMRLLLRGDLVCRQAAGLITGYLEGRLSRPARKRFERHLAACPHCADYLEQMRAAIRLTGRLAPENLTPQMPEEFTGLYRRWRSEQQ